MFNMAAVEGKGQIDADGKLYIDADGKGQADSASDENCCCAQGVTCANCTGDISSVSATFSGITVCPCINRGGISQAITAMGFSINGTFDLAPGANNCTWRYDASSSLTSDIFSSNTVCTPPASAPGQVENGTHTIIFLFSGSDISIINNFVVSGIISYEFFAGSNAASAGYVCTSKNGASFTNGMSTSCSGSLTVFSATGGSCVMAIT